MKEFAQPVAGNGEEGAALRFTEEEGVEALVRQVELHGRADLLGAADGALGQGNEQAAFSEIVGAADVAGANGGNDGGVQLLLAVEVELGRRAALEAMDLPQVETGAELLADAVLGRTAGRIAITVRAVVECRRAQDCRQSNCRAQYPPARRRRPPSGNGRA